MQNLKEFKRGEVLMAEGETPEFVYIIQSGRVQLYIERSGKRVDIEQLSTGQIVGDHALYGPPRAVISAVADTNCKVLVLPLKGVKTVSENAGPGIKMILKSFFEGLKKNRNMMRSLKMEADNSPMPEILIPRLFSVYVLMCRHLGKEEEGKHIVSWEALKRYSSRVFLESATRMQRGIELLTKLNYAEMIMAKDEDGDEILSDIHFLNLQIIEDFAEFFQYHYYKAGRSESIIVDDMAYKVTRVLADMAVDKEVNHKGAVTLDYDEALKTIKTRYRIEIKNTHWDLLEKKGLFIQRKSTDDGMLLLFDREEFAKNAIFWQILLEIKKWNEQGFVDMNEKEEVFEAVGGDDACPDCDGNIETSQKFCHHCGHKVAA